MTKWLLFNLLSLFVVHFLIDSGAEQMWEEWEKPNKMKWKNKVMTESETADDQRGRIRALLTFNINIIVLIWDDVCISENKID